MSSVTVVLGKERETRGALDAVHGVTRGLPGRFSISSVVSGHGLTKRWEWVSVGPLVVRGAPHRPTRV